MRCSKIRRLLGGYVDGYLAPPVAAKMEQHLDSCPACAEAVDKTRSLEELFRTEHVPAPPPGLVGAIRLAAAAPAPSRRPVSVFDPGRAWLGRLAMATAVVLVFLGGSYLGTLAVDTPGRQTAGRSSQGLQEIVADTFSALPGGSSIEPVLAVRQPMEDVQ